MLALADVLRNWSIEGDEPVILDQDTIERPFGWVFFYDSRRHQETDEFEYTLAGNAPLIVNRHDGSLYSTGTALPVEHYIRAYEERLASGIRNTT